MRKLKIMWVDDEIESLKPLVLFLQEKGYELVTHTNGTDAIATVLEDNIDLVLLDEMMPGLDGLTTLEEIKQINPSLPVIMVTKSEEEGLMENAIASKIEDYLIKPINPNQIILAIKKIFQTEEIMQNRIGAEYAKFSSQTNQALFNNPDWEDWKEIYFKICDWDLKLDEINDPSLRQTHFLEKKNFNTEFCNYVESNYQNWIYSDKRPSLSFDLISEYVGPQIEKSDGPVYFIIIDCMRLDQYRAIEPFIAEMFDIDFHTYYSILPTATPYSRNSIFSGMLPIDIAKLFPEYWSESSELDSSRNRNEHQLLDAHLSDIGYDIDTSKYVKIFTMEEGNFVIRKVESWQNEELVILVYNFLDLVTHQRSKNQVLMETIPNEKALRAFTKHWFLHSTLYGTLKQIKKQGGTVILSTDHGSIRVNRATQVIGDRETTTTVRYKKGKNLSANSRHAFFVKKPNELGLPTENIVDNYIFTKEDYYFVYPNSFHQYQKQFAETFQHGGISMEEMILPLAICTPKK